MKNTLDKIETYLLYAVIFLLPILVLPISPNVFVVGKLALLTYGVLALLLIRAARVILEGKLDLHVGKYDLPVALIAVAYIASTILKTPNKMEALLLPGTATVIVASAVLYFLINQLGKSSKAKVPALLFASASIFSLLSILAYSKVLAKIPQLPGSMKAEFFTPEGGFLPAAIFLGSLLPIGISFIIKQKNIARKALFGVSTAIIIFELVISVYNLMPGRIYAAKFPSYATCWSVAVDALKESPFLGIGPANYLTAFSRFRPISFNNTDLWAVKFSTARSFYLTLLTETGMLGAAGIILLVLALYQTIKSEPRKHLGISEQSSNTASLLILLLLLLFFPATPLIKIMLFVLLALVSQTTKTSLNLTAQPSSAGLKSSSAGEGTGENQSAAATRVPAMLIGIPVIVASLYLGFQAGKILAAEYTFNKAVRALTQNKAQETYNLMIKAINLNPRVDRYHSTNSRINLALANSLAGQEEITDNDRGNIAQLVQQSISEGKAAVALNPLRSGNWSSLGRIYQAIIPLATGADAFAIQTLRQAVALDPINPNTRVALGGVYYAQGDFGNAVRAFELATAAKPDHANAHYNLAFALKEAGQLDRAIQEMTLVLSLIDRTTGDYEIARRALADMQEKRAAQAPTGEELIPPQEAEAPVLEPPLDLPEESEPPAGPEAAAPITPTPTPDESGETVTVTPQVTPTPTP